MAKEFTQQEVADKLKISRTSYLAMEQGKREPTLSEAERLGKILGITVEELSVEAQPNYPKYLEMIVCYLNLVSGDGKLPKTKLAKLLYLADFAWFYTELESMSGMAYRKIQYGPVADPYFRAIDELQTDGLISVQQKDDALLISGNTTARRNEDKHLSIQEKSLITKIYKKWESKNTNEIVRFTHEQLPYKLSFVGEIIPYALITQEDGKYVY
jgi:transcriptional regulator with XRE-family HTH domain